MSDEQRSGGAPTDEERARAVREQLKSLHAFDLAYEMMVGLVTFGYQKMGLTDETSELRDLGDARLAIELLRANLEVVEREQGDERTPGTCAPPWRRCSSRTRRRCTSRASRAGGRREEPAAEASAAAEQPADRPKPAARKSPRPRGSRRRRSRRPRSRSEEAGAAEEDRRSRRSRLRRRAGRRDLIRPHGELTRGDAGGAPLCRRQVLAQRPEARLVEPSPGSTTMNSSSWGPATSFSRKRSEPVRRSSGRS